MHQKGGDLNRDRRVARPGGWLDWVAKTLIYTFYLFKHVHFFVNFLIGGCGSGACKWRACFPAFVSSFYCKK
jgi:hypothetical protein